MKKDKISKYAIFNHLKRQMERIGGNWRHMHDTNDPRELNLICFFPAGYLVFVRIEPSGIPTPGYRKTQALFDRCGAMQYLIDSTKTVDQFIQSNVPQYTVHGQFTRLVGDRGSITTDQNDLSIDEKETAYPNW